MSAAGVLLMHDWDRRVYREPVLKYYDVIELAGTLAVLQRNSEAGVSKEDLAAARAMGHDVAEEWAKIERSKGFSKK